MADPIPEPFDEGRLDVGDGHVLYYEQVSGCLGDPSWVPPTPLEPVETYLAYLAALERSPNRQRAYATSLKLWFGFLDRIERSWAGVDIDDVAQFVSRLRAPADNVVVLAAGDAVRSA